VENTASRAGRRPTNDGLLEDVRSRLEAVGLEVTYEENEFTWTDSDGEWFGDRGALMDALEEAELHAEIEALPAEERQLAERYAADYPVAIPAAQLAHRQRLRDRRAGRRARTGHARESRPAAPRVRGSRRSQGRSAGGDDGGSDPPPPRHCACGCDASLDGRRPQTRHVDDAYRMRAARAAVA
jgi:hypothetical protein